MKEYKSPLQKAAEMFPQTQLWNDSCGIADLDLALKRGCCGATSNPVIVWNVLKKESHLWAERLKDIITREMPDATDEEICWKISGEVGLKGAQKLLPLFYESHRLRGWQAMQVNPRFYRSTEKTVAHAVELASLCENILIKMPVSTADIPALEECVYRGISVNGTVCFGVPQTVAVAEAIERGLKRRETEGLDINGMMNSCTIMTGRIDDYMKKLVSERETPITQEYLDCGGEAVLKKVYKLYKERGYRVKLLVANNHSHFLWSRFLGGDLLMTVNPVWWRRMEGATFEVRRTIDEDVDSSICNELLDKIPEYRSIYYEDGLKAEEFDRFGAFKDTMSEFFQGYDAFINYLRGFILG